MRKAAAVCPLGYKCRQSSQWSVIFHKAILSDFLTAPRASGGVFDKGTFRLSACRADPIISLHYFFRSAR
jgi:hypothetical protein